MQCETLRISNLHYHHWVREYFFREETNWKCQIIPPHKAARNSRAHIKWRLFEADSNPNRFNFQVTLPKCIACKKSTNIKSGAGGLLVSISLYHTHASHRMQTKQFLISFYPVNRTGRYHQIFRDHFWSTWSCKRTWGSRNSAWLFRRISPQ